MNYSEEIIQQIWEHGRGVSELDSSEWRQDQCGAWMKREMYGHTHSDFGWTIHSLSPGDSGVDNLRPFQCQNEVNGASGQVQCHVTADRNGLSPTQQIEQPRNKSA